jgi:asparagine synthase (glutamine-hydrolysing)
MCGICGFTGHDEERVRRMADRLAHRGPDQHGTFVDNHVSLAHRRLSIVDLSERASQPMSNEDGSVWLVYNGEIYNHADLRPELEALGHRFKSDTDTEVVIHAYEEYGVDAIKRMRGMFAFALWDQ